MKTSLLGLSYKTAGLALRERLHFSEEKLQPALEKLKSFDGVEEAAILSTCNRVEIYVGSENEETITNSLKKFLVEFHAISPAEIDKYMYEKSGKEAVKHLFNVTSSLDSLVVGENQILGQVKKAYDYAKDGSHTGSQLNRLFQSAISIGKKVRTTTAIGEGAVSVGSAAVDLVKEIFPKGYAFQVLVLGAGKISELTAKSLKDYGRVDLVVINRSFERARTLAAEYNGIAVPFEERYKYIVSSDVIIVSTSSPDFVVESENLKTALAKSKMGRMYFFIDLSVPRNIDPLVQQVDNAVLYAIDDLSRIVKSNIKKRKKEIDKTKKVIDEGVDEFEYWFYKKRLIASLSEWEKIYTELDIATIHRAFQNQGSTLFANQEDLLSFFQGLKEEENPIKYAIKKVSTTDELKVFHRVFTSLPSTYKNLTKINHKAVS